MCFDVKQQTPINAYLQEFVCIYIMLSETDGSVTHNLNSYISAI